jgi:signal transduction histidine kinase
MISMLRRIIGWRKAPSLAFAGTVALAYLGTLWDSGHTLTGTRGAWCLVMGAAYALVGMVDYHWLCHRTRWLGRVLYLGVQGGLLFGILWTGRLSGQTPLCVYPMVAAIVTLLDSGAVVLGVAGLYGMTLAVEGHFYGMKAAVSWSISMIPGFAFVVIFTWIALREIAARNRVEALSAEVEQLAVIQERNRLAREIHDSLGHFLTTIHVQLQAARAIHATDPARAMEAVEKAQGLARDALAEVRRSVGALQADRAAVPLAQRLRELASATDGWGAAVSLETLGPVRPLAPEAEHALFRAAQEGLTNVRKHAQARTARVTLDYRDPARVFVRVTDDGRGRADGRAGCGLTGLGERISALGGCVVAENPAGGGFRLQVEIPS